MQEWLFYVLKLYLFIIDIIQLYHCSTINDAWNRSKFGCKRKGEFISIKYMENLTQELFTHIVTVPAVIV